MNKDKVQNQNILGTLVNKDESGIIAYSDQIYDKKSDRSLEEENVKQNERLDNVEAKDREFQSTLENITKTGEASAASNVTYNHNDSKLDATNVQQAVDEVRKRSNYNDGDNIIDFNTIHLITDNPEFVCVAVDVNEKILYGIKTDGQPYFGVGCPQQVKDYIDKQINKILGTDDITTTIDSLKEIESFLKDFTNSDTLKKLLDLKANVDEVKTTTDDIYKKSNPNDSEGNVVDTNTIVSIENNPEYIKVITDNVGKLIEAIGIDGIRKFFAGIEIQGIYQCVVDNPDYIIAWVDKENKIIFAIQPDGNPYFGYGVPKQIKNDIDKINADIVNKYTEIKQSISDTNKHLSETSADIDKKINLGNNVYPNNVHEVSSIGEYNSVLIDSLNHILESLDSDGVRKFFAGIDVAGNKFTTTNDPEYKAVLLDKDNKILIGIRNDGDVYFAAGVPKQMRFDSEIDDILEDVTELQNDVSEIQDDVRELHDEIPSLIPISKYIKLYENDFKSNSGLTITGNWSFGQNGATPSAAGSGTWFRLNKNYWSDKRFMQVEVSMKSNTNLIITCTSSSVNDGEGASCFAVDFASGLLKIFSVGAGDNQATASGYTSTVLESEDISDIVAEHTYRIRLYKDSTLHTLEITDMLTGITKSVSHNGWAAGRQNQRYGFYVDSGSLPTLKNISIYTLNRPNVVFTGDSITEGVMVTDRTKRYAELYRTNHPHLKVVISAMGGRRLSELISMFDNEWAICKPKILSCLIGANGGNSQNGFESLKAKCDSIGCKLIVHYCTCQQSNDSHIAKNELIGSLPYRGARFDIATAKDNYPLVGSQHSAPRYNSSLYYDSGLHPNTDGDEVMYSRMMLDCIELDIE